MTDQATAYPEEHPMADQTFTDSHPLDLTPQLVRCPCGETFDRHDHPACPNCGHAIGSDESPTVKDEPAACGEHVGVRRPTPVDEPQDSLGHAAHLQEILAVRDLEAHLRSRAYPVADPGTVHDLDSFLAFLQVLTPQAARADLTKLTAPTLLQSTATWLANPKNRPPADYPPSWNALARMFLAGVAPSKTR